MDLKERGELESGSRPECQHWVLRQRAFVQQEYLLDRVKLFHCSVPILLDSLKIYDQVETQPQRHPSLRLDPFSNSSSKLSWHVRMA